MVSTSFFLYICIMGKIKLKKGHFYKTREYTLDRSYTIICPNKDIEVDYINECNYIYIECVFVIRGSGKRSYLSYTRETNNRFWHPSAKLTNSLFSPIRTLTKRDYWRIEWVLRQNHFIYNKRTYTLVNTKNKTKWSF